jgi:excisionase family DNA binding protein
MHTKRHSTLASDVARSEIPPPRSPAGRRPALPLNRQPLAPLTDVDDLADSSETDAAARRPASIEEHIEAAVARAVARLLGPYLKRLSVLEPMVFTVGQVAELMQVSEDTVGRMVKRGVLPRVPHLGGKILIPRRAVERLASGTDQPDEAVTELPVNARSIRSAAARSDAGMK